MTLITCLKCGTVLWSGYSGEYKECGCPNNAMVDETKHYTRYGAVSIKHIKKEVADSHFLAYAKSMRRKNLIKEKL